MILSGFRTVWGGYVNWSSDRLSYIDGIKGIAALLVVFCHLACVFVPELYFDNQATSFFSRLWLHTPLNVITNGDTAVQCFFVLSGFLITRRVYNKHTNGLATPMRLYIKYLRIVFPAVLFSVILMCTGMMKHIEASAINDTLNFVNGYNNFDITIKNIINDIFIRTFYKGSEYVGPLWTIRFEMIGSIITYCFSWFAYNNDMKCRKYSYIFFMALSFLMLPRNIIAFLLGAFAYDCVFFLDEDRTFIGRIVYYVANNGIIRCFFVLIGFYLLSCNIARNGMWKPLSYTPISGEIYRALGVAICIFIVSIKSTYQHMFEGKAVKKMGQLSPYVYAFHWQIILSIGCGMYLLLQKCNYWVAVGIIAILVILFSYILAQLYLLIVPKIQIIENRIFKSIVDILQVKKSNNS